MLAVEIKMRSFQGLDVRYEPVNLTLDSLANEDIGDKHVYPKRQMYQWRYICEQTISVEKHLNLYEM